MKQIYKLLSKYSNHNNNTKTITITAQVLQCNKVFTSTLFLFISSFTHVCLFINQLPLELKLL